jgi:small ligand-binding sensory domain FIST
MHFASATTTRDTIDGATHHLLDQAREQTGDLDVDLVLLFVSPHFETAAPHVTRALRKEFGPRILLGCTGEGVIGRHRELENQPAMSLITASLPGVQVAPFALHPDGLDQVLDEPGLFLKTVAPPDQPSLFLLIGDPYSMRTDTALNLFNTFFSDVPVVGGMASAPQGQNALFYGDRVLTGGAVGIALAGSLDVDVVVSQGCRAIGPLLTITEARENIILGLDGLPPVLQLEKLVSRLPREDRELARKGLLVGRQIRGSSSNAGRGDYLLRGIMGVDPASGAIAVGDYVNSGQAIRFHLHDASIAREDLELMLSPQTLYGQPSGALVFACNGRGQSLYGEPDGDITTIQRYLGNAHLAGLFCAGEIGPVAGQNFVHGHTASMAIFRPQMPDGGP